MPIPVARCLVTVLLAHARLLAAKARESQRRWTRLNLEKTRENARRYHAANRERINASKRTDEYRAWQRQHKRQKTGGRPMEVVLAEKRIDPAVKRIRGYLRNRLRNVIRRPVKVRQDRVVGCDHRQLKAWLERQFEPGMTWENYGRVWEVDHEIPLCRFDVRREDQMLIASHFSNLRPLFKHDNKEKHGRLPANAQPQLPLCST